MRLVLNDSRLGGVLGWGLGKKVPGRCSDRAKQGQLGSESQQVGWGGLAMGNTFSWILYLDRPGLNS